MYTCNSCTPESLEHLVIILSLHHDGVLLPSVCVVNCVLYY